MPVSLTFFLMPRGAVFAPLPLALEGWLCFLFLLAGSLVVDFSRGGLYTAAVEPKVAKPIAAMRLASGSGEGEGEAFSLSSSERDGEGESEARGASEDMEGVDREVRSTGVLGGFNEIERWEKSRTVDGRL